MNEELMASLRNGVTEICFVKRDGTIREMKASLHERDIPVVTYSSTKTFNPLSVWDIEKNAWRSFKLDSVISWRKL